jgi:hypothetical protein
MDVFHTLQFHVNVPSSILMYESKVSFVRLQDILQKWIPAKANHVHKYSCLVFFGRVG